MELTIGRLDWEIQQRARSDPRARVLTQVQGSAPFTAPVILAGVADVSRFGSVCKLASWAGLTPAVRGSDLIARFGHIYKRLGVAALGVWARQRRPPSGTRSSPPASRAPQTVGKEIATTAVACKLLTRAWHLFTDAGRIAAAQPAEAAAVSRAGDAVKHQQTVPPAGRSPGHRGQATRADQRHGDPRCGTSSLQRQPGHKDSREAAGRSRSGWLAAGSPGLEDGVNRLRHGDGQSVLGGPSHDEAVQGL
jgi:hypothetical protein